MSNCNCDELNAKLSKIISLVKALKKENEELKKRITDLENEEIKVEIDLTSIIKKALGL